MRAKSKLRSLLCIPTRVHPIQRSVPRICQADEAESESPDKLKRRPVTRLTIQVLESDEPAVGTPKFNEVEKPRRKRQEYFAMENYRSETLGVPVRQVQSARQVHTMDCKVKQYREGMFASTESFNRRLEKQQQQFANS